MSLELTDEERALVDQVRRKVNAALFGLYATQEFAVMLTAILKTQAAKMKAEFRLEYYALVYDNRNCDDPRHTWTDDQWLEAAKQALTDTEVK